MTERSTEDSQAQKHVTLGKDPLGKVNGNTSSRRKSNKARFLIVKEELAHVVCLKWIMCGC